MFKYKFLGAVLAVGMLSAPTRTMFGQQDQGTITGVVEDSTGALIGNASVTLTNLDQGQVLHANSDGSGVFVFSPIKIGSYEVAATAPGFQTTKQENLHLDIQQRLNVVVKLQTGTIAQSVVVTGEPPLLQTQDTSVGQTFNTEQINNVPLNGRNWVYIAQLAPGVALPAGSRGAGKGDFNSNGQRAEENNFTLDGIDNNANSVDFFNGASYIVNPPPDALSEFKVQTSNYSAQFGHSAGAVVNASIKSGSNQLHGSLWEYVRNTSLDTYSWTDNKSLPIPAYHNNIFGGTIGGPILKNKLFLFADVQANRIVSYTTQALNVPTAAERVGDFSELLNSNLTGSNPVQLYSQTPNSPAVAITNNCLAGGTPNCPIAGAAGLTLNPTALKMLSLYPLPNTNGGKLYSNYTAALPVIDNTFQYDVRADWTISDKDSAYSRYSFYNEMGENPPVLGNVIDGGGSSGGSGDGSIKNLGANFMASETHIFSPKLVNEARFGFGYLHAGFVFPNATNPGYAASLGFGGIPGGTLNGGLPAVNFSGPASPQFLGSPNWSVTDEHNNVFEIIDNVTRVAGNHSLTAGVSYQNVRFSTLQPQQPRGSYNYTGQSTENPANSTNTGYGLADFLLDEMNNSSISNAVTTGDQRDNFATYFQDDWRVRSNLTLNLGLRYEHFNPVKEVGGSQASLNFTGPASFDPATGRGSVTGQYLIPSMSKARAQSFFAQYGFDQALAADGVNVVYDSNPRLQTTSDVSFAPRVGVSWSPDSKTAVRVGYGIFYGGAESIGYWGNLGENYPFQYAASFNSASCTVNYCPTLSSNPNYNVNIANGFSTILQNGFASVVTGLGLRGTDAHAKSTYTQSWNLSLERAFTNQLTATVAYVGNTSRHLPINVDTNAPLALENPGNNTQSARPMPDYNGAAYVAFAGMSDYNSLQTKVEKQMSHGYSLLASYTWSHALDDAVTPLGSSGDGNYRQYNLIPTSNDYANSAYNVAQRFTFNSVFDLPFGEGRDYLNHNQILDAFVGGWSTDLQFQAQTGNFFTVGTANVSTAAGFNNGPFANQVANEFAGGGGSNCPKSVKNRTNWYNPCSYANPWDAGATTINGAPNPHYIPKSTNDPLTPAGDNTPVYVTDFKSVLGYAGGKRDNAVGPGFERINMSIFKNFNLYREHQLSFRADIFNLFNTPSLGLPSTSNNSASGGNITSYRSLQAHAPDGRFIQLSLKYAF